MPKASLEVSGLALTRAASPQVTPVTLGPISFTLPYPGCWWLTGVSGSGKSLLLDSLAGFHAEAHGSIRVSGDEVAHLAPERRNIALMPQRWRLFPHWTVRRNLQFAAKLSKTPPDRIIEFAQVLKIDTLLDRPTSALSGGETQRIALLQTLLSPAKVILLDEPLSAIDAALQSSVLDLLSKDLLSKDLLSKESAQHGRICLIAAHRATVGYPMQGTFCLERGQLHPQSER